MKKIVITAIFAALIGTALVVAGTTWYVQSLVVHPDHVITVENPTTKQRTQSYLIGDLQVYIEQTYRIDMKLWQTYVDMNGFGRFGEEYKAISGTADDRFSMLSGGKDANPNPFIVKLRIINVGKQPRQILSRQTLIHRSDGTLVAPNPAWQEQLAKAGLFSGVSLNDKDIINPGEAETMYLVYATPVAENPFAQEQIRMHYGSDQDWLAVKVEFPFNFVYGTPYGDYKEITSKGYDRGAIILLAMYAVIGTIAYRKARAL